jgi:hypothetical protein
MTIETQTPEQIARHFSACIDSVNLINAGQPEGMTAEDWADCLSRNKEHLVIMLAKNIFSGYDVQPLINASS